MNLKWRRAFARREYRTRCRLRGPTDARYMLVLPDKSLFTEAYFMTGLYFLAFVMIFILYYGIHYLAFGS